MAVQEHPGKISEAIPVCQICGYDTLSGMPDRGLKGAKAPSQVSKVSRQAITLGNLQSTDKTYEVCL